MYIHICMYIYIDIIYIYIYIYVFMQTMWSGRAGAGRAGSAAGGANIAYLSVSHAQPSVTLSAPP